MCPNTDAASSKSHHAMVNGKRSPPSDEEERVNHGSNSSKRPKLTVLKNKIDRTNDDIHSSIDICPVVKLILDSPPMQRLRRVKQLATAEHVYVNCTHNRLEHSLGVAHLAERLCQRIAKRQPALGVTAKDVLCVKLAGLLHDVGHGPFSHTFEDFLRILPEYLKEHPEKKKEYAGLPDLPKNYKHETVSLMLIDAVLESKGLRINVEKLDEPLEKITTITAATISQVDPLSVRVFDVTTSMSEVDVDTASMILTSRDFVFIKECIWGGPLPEFGGDTSSSSGQGFVGRRERRQRWLYDVVSNANSGLDVDKIDYYARDQRAAFKGSGEIDKLFVEEAVVAWGACPRGSASNSDDDDGKQLMICYPQKVVASAMEFFRTRFRLHKTVYRHKKNDAVGYLICDILTTADPYFRLKIRTTESGGSKRLLELPISRAMHNANAFLRLTDSVIELIENTDDERLQEAHALIKRLSNGNFYRCVAVKRIDLNNPMHRKMLRLSPSTKNEGKAINRRMKEIEHELIGNEGKGGEDQNRTHGNGTLPKGSLIVEMCKIHCGRGKNNPLERMRFLQKHQMERLESATTIEEIPEAKEEDEANYEALMPRSFEEMSIRVFCKGDSAECELASHVFDQWWLENTEQKMQTTPPRQMGSSEGVTPSPSTLATRSRAGSRKQIKSVFSEKDSD